jgi:transposase-like protein
MPIILDLGRTVQDYIAHFEHIVFPRPAFCPHCRTWHMFIGHGFYDRRPKDPTQVYYIKIKRWLCKACRATLSQLPSFLLRFRHYLLAIIEQVLLARFEQAQSWQQIERQVAVADLPAPSTLRRWCRAFAGHALAWWAAAQATLARLDSASPALDALSPAAGPHNAPQGLLHAATHLLAWAQTQWAELADYGLKYRLRFLWQWGWGQGLGRLI